MSDTTKTSSQTSKSSSTAPASSMAELMSRMGSNVQVLQKGQIIEGKIKKLAPGEILMDIGGKGDALVIEFDRQKLESLLSLLKIGDTVKASVISPESEEGFPVVSLRRMLDDMMYSKFEKLLSNEEAFEVNITESTRGGYFAENKEGVKGFLPSSQVTSGDNLVGKTIKVKVIEFDRSKKRVVFSEKATSFITSPAAMQKLIKRGDKVEGIVTSVNPYGLYVTISAGDGQIEGFVHISEVAYERISDLSLQFKVGDKITAEVKDLDEANRRVNLSIKKTKEDTFATIREKYKKEDKVKGVVTEVKSRGVSVKLAEGISGFIPSDKIPSGTTYKEGDEVNAEVVDFDDRRRVILLSPVLKAVPIGYR